MYMSIDLSRRFLMFMFIILLLLLLLLCLLGTYMFACLNYIFESLFTRLDTLEKVLWYLILLAIIPFTLKHEGGLADSKYSCFI